MIKLAELALLIKAELYGDPNAEVARVRPFDIAASGDVTLAMDPNIVARIADSGATAIIVSSPIAGLNQNLLVCRDPKLGFARAIEALHKSNPELTGVSSDLITGTETVLGKDLSIHPRVTIGREVVI